MVQYKEEARKEMKIIKCLKHAFNMVVHSRLRSWLTIIGIVIGVASVIAIISLGQGLQSEITSQIGNIGADLITITPGHSRSGGFRGRRDFGEGGSSSATTDKIVLDRTDLQVLKGIPELSIIETEIKGSVDVTYNGKTGSVSLTGVDQKVWSQITTESIASGRFLDSADSNVIVIGGKLAESYFDQPLGINKMLTIEGNVFRIVGILDDSSTNIYMPISMATTVIDDKESGVYDSIIVKVKDVDTMNDTLTKIEKRLMMVRHVTDKTKDFTVSSNAQSQAMRANLLSSMTLFLTAIAAVSLLVGAVGIANTMFTSVLEKTKEIGIMKAIGARNRDILVIFLMNAGLIGLVGGLLGVIFGTMLSAILPAIMGNTPLVRGGTMVSLQLVAISLTLSVLVGMLAGFIPAWKASKLRPVDALRYE